MEFQYVSYLCHNLLGLHEPFAKAFHNYRMNHSLNDPFKFYYNEEFVTYMVMMLRSGKEFDFTKYSKLNDLFDYMIGMEELGERRDSLLHQKNYLKYVKKKNKIREFQYRIYFLRGFGGGFRIVRKLIRVYFSFI